MRRLRVAFVESFLGESHRAFALGWAERSAHAMTLLSLPGERWKWRMRSAAWVLGEQLAALRPRPHVVVATGLLDLAHLRQAARDLHVPFLLYFHENQLSYPRPRGSKLDRGFATAHLASLLAADGVAFNSRFQREEMLREMRAFLAEMPAPRPRGVLTRISRARVLAPGLDLAGFPEPRSREPASPPAIVWNHRWEEDKRPSAFARVMFRLAEREAPFQLILLGKTSQVEPTPLLEMRSRLAERTWRGEPARTRKSYVSWLARGDIAVSTAAQENFGYAVLEAMAAGCVPLLPERLSYPEILPPALRDTLLYPSERALGERLESWLRDPPLWTGLRARAMRAARRHEWTERVQALDAWAASAGRRA